MYAYRARSPLGKTFDGQIDAATMDEARQMLRRDGLEVLSLHDEEDAAESGLLGKRVTRRDIICVTTQLAVMVETGITLSSALESLITEEKNLTLRKVLADLKDAVEGGEDFSAALERQPKYFDKVYVSLVRASEATGTLGEMLDRIATYLGKELDNRGKVRAALAYPTVMLVLAIGVTIFMLTYVLPKFAPLFSRQGVTLPKMTSAMIAASDAMILYWYAWLGGIVALVVGVAMAKRTPAGALTWDWIKLNLPIFGLMMRKVAIARSLNTLGTMVGSGVSVLDALKLSSEVAGNLHYEQMWNDVREKVTQGREICEALSSSSLMPSMLVQMIASGERTGKLDMVLQRISVYYEREVDSAIKTATSMIEPIMICTMGVVVGAIAMGLLMPIFSLSKPGG